MAGASIKAHFLDSQLWFVAKAILKTFFPNRPGTVRILEFAPTRAHTLQYANSHARVFTDKLEFPGQGPGA